MKPIKRRTGHEEPERGETDSVAGGDVERTRWDDRADNLEGDEGNGGAYGRPRPEDEDESGDRSRERG